MTRAWVEVDLAALCRNGAAVAARSGVPLMPMVKADGYGIGGLRAALALDALEPWGFGVATVDEGEELRRGGITRPIVVFTPIMRTEIDALRRADLTPALGDPAVIESWTRTARDWHLQVDTGMSRAGLRWDDVGAHRDLLQRSRPSGVFTHFHSADLDDPSRDAQESRFASALAALPERPALVHAENGPAVEARAPSPWTICRPGIFLYGVATRSGPLVPEPVVTVRARIVEIRTVPDGETVSYGGTWRAEGPRRIATIPVGYADGYRRVLGNRGVALLGGRRIPVAGRVTMDMTMLDVTDTDAALGDVVTLLGRDGDEVLTVSELATLGELSPYELLTGFRARLPRVYRQPDSVEAAA
ncbi:MAG TPA: alanine racemase [Gemmatimonadaceae bacterium]|jgi:alanine racemase|nr:alanine racemase [Gemmatimonadaceae bacterium]